MPPLSAALLRHERRKDRHFDWLIEPPRGAVCPAGRLWCVRVDRPWHDWAATGTMLLTVLPPHRRHYLTYQGPISGGRGSVVRVGRGTIEAHLWTPSRMLLTLHRLDGPGRKPTPHRLSLDRLTAQRWRLVVET